MRVLPPPPHLLMLAALTSGAPAEPEPPAGSWRVRPESREYCGELFIRLSRLPAGHQEPSRSLGTEGVRLCESGHVRTGVAKLRRAIREAQGD